MNKEILKEYLSNRYQGWHSFLNNVIFPIFGEDDFESGFETELLEIQPERKQLAEATGIRSIKQIGMIYVGVEPLHIFDVTVNDRVMMERNRVNIQRLIRSVMDQYSCAFMLFHYEDDARWDWRFTYCRKSGNKEESTDSKRYTFLLGPGQSCRTATDNFMALYGKRNSLEIKDIEDAFNVEALSKEFFGKYKTQYETFVNYMVDPTNGMRQHFIDTDFDHTGMTADKIRDREEKPIRDYVKKLLGRIVFLHFLQKKGWLGVPAGKEWGEGDRNFMLNIFKNANENQKGNFLEEILEGLFAEALDRDRSAQDDLYDTKVEGFHNCRIPYLNGGLFERDILEKKSCHFPASFFDSLLTMLSQYNFTIKEDIQVWNWDGVNIKNESQGNEKDNTSIQYHVIQKLKSQDFDIIFDDDNAGEIADVIAIKVDDINKVVKVELFHLKFSQEDHPGARINDLYAVNGQAQKCVSWLHSRPEHIIGRMLRRGTTKAKNRYELGTENQLSIIKEKVRSVYNTEYIIHIVQPGLSKAAASTDQLKLLSITEAFLWETRMIKLQVIASA